jgi:LmbE family N-acetylglucosaminyl deacetylase
MLGVQHIHCFDYGDGKLQDLPLAQLTEPIVRLIREFQPEVVFTFDESGAYGHPDHIAISEATTKACQLAGQSNQFVAQLDGGLTPFAPPRLLHACFPQSGLLLLDLIVQWLQSLDVRFRGSDDFMHGLMLFADESTMLGYASDHIKVEWYPGNFYLIEQGEPATALYLLLSGSVNVLREDEDGNLMLLEALGPGTFIGETGIAYGQPRNAHVVTVRNATCLVFSPGKPTNFAGRGEEAKFAAEAASAHGEQPAATVCIDVSDFIEQKMLALTKHRTQYPIEPEMFPLSFLQALMGQEYFVQIEQPRGLETTLFPTSHLAKE